MSLLGGLFSVGLARAITRAPLEMTSPWKWLPKVCQTRLLATPRSSYLREAYLAQGRKLGGLRAKRHIAAEPALAAHWRLIELFNECVWIDAIEGSRATVHRAAPGPIRIRVHVDLKKGFQDALWIDFMYPDEPASREFFRLASRLLWTHLQTAKFTRTTPAKVFPWDPRTQSVLVLVGNDFDDIGPTDLSALDAIGEFNFGFLAHLLARRKQKL